MTAGPQDREGRRARSNLGGPHAVIAAMMGREPDRNVRARIEAVRSAIGAREDDAIWVVLGVFESAIDRGERVYRLYIHCLVVAVVVMVTVSITTLYVSDERLRSDATAMRTAVASAIRQAACGGIGEQDACQIARIGMSTPARRAVSGVISRLPDGVVEALASTPYLDQWLDWIIKSAAGSSASQNAAGPRKAGRSHNGQ